MSQDFVRLLLVMIGIAVGAFLVIAGLVYAGGSGRRSKRYRPGRPFVFTPVWFLAAPERQARAGVITGRELTAAAGPSRIARPRETGGAGDRW